MWRCGRRRRPEEQQLAGGRLLRDTDLLLAEIWSIIALNKKIKIFAFSNQLTAVMRNTQHVL